MFIDTSGRNLSDGQMVRKRNYTLMPLARVHAASTVGQVQTARHAKIGLPSHAAPACTAVS